MPEWGDILQEFSTDFRVFCGILLIIGVFFLVLYFYDIEWSNFKAKSKPLEKRGEQQTAKWIGFSLFFFGFVGLVASSYYLWGLEVSGFVKYDDGLAFPDAEIIVPGSEHGYTNGNGYYELKNVQRNQSHISVKFKDKIIHIESIYLPQTSLGYSYKQDLIVPRIPLKIHGNINDMHGLPVEGIIVNLSSYEANLTTKTNFLGYFSFRDILVHQRPIGPQGIKLSFQSADEREPRFTDSVAIPLEEPYQAAKNVVWIKEDVDVKGCIAPMLNNTNFNYLVVNMGTSYDYPNSSGYYSLINVPISTKTWHICSSTGKELANGTIYPSLTVIDNPAWRPLLLNAH